MSKDRLALYLEALEARLLLDGTSLQAPVPAVPTDWSTYLGGNGRDGVASVAVDKAGNVYVGGRTESGGWVSGGYDQTYGGSGDGFVAKLSAGGELLWSTYLGGGAEDTARSVAVDGEGNVYAAGIAHSSDWDVGAGAFLIQFSSSGARLWSMHLAGPDVGGAFVDTAGNVYVCGEGGFVSKISPGGDTIWTTHVSGFAYSAAVGPSGDVYVVGNTNGGMDGFVVKLSSAGDPLWSSYLGGAGKDDAIDVAVDSGGDVYVVGGTSSAGWVGGGFDSSLEGASDGFLVKLSADGDHLWSTYLGGPDNEYALGIAIDGLGNICVAGTVSYSGSAAGSWYAWAGDDGFVTKLSASGDLLESALIGGTERERANEIAADSGGNVYVVGETYSSGWVAGGYDASYNGNRDGFVVVMPPTTSLPEARVAFVSGTAPGPLYVMDSPDGQPALVPVSVTALYPEWSKNGEWLTFCNGQIYVTRPDGSGFRQVTNVSGDFTEPSFSPDGSKIVFNQVYGPLYVINTDGTGLTQLPVSGAFAEWSPDGKEILYSNWGLTSNSDLFVLDLASGTSTQLTHHAPNEAFLMGQWSPDGSEILVGERDWTINKGDIYVMNADGSALTNLTPDWSSSYEEYPSWSPDGQYVFFQSDRSGTNDVWVMAADGSGRTDLTNTPNISEFFPATAPLFVNHAPVAVDDTVVTDEDTPLLGNVLANDTYADGDPLGAILIGLPANGSLDLNLDGSFTYTPNLNFNGSDSFTYIANDGQFESNVATVRITVNPVNDAPVAYSQTISVTEDGVATILLSGSDVETPESNLTFTVTSLLTTGVLRYQGKPVEVGQQFVGPPPLTYEPGLSCGEFRSDGLNFTVTDNGDPAGSHLSPGDLTSEPATVSINVTAAVAPGAVTMDASGIVRIGGTESADTILITHTRHGHRLKVTINSQVVSRTISLSEVKEIRAWGRGGDDTIEVRDLGIKTFLSGGSGNDTLTGGAGSDLIVGGAGDDTTVGAAGDDFLIGGKGSDRIVGSAGNDILVAGDIGCSFSISDLRSVLAAWVLYKAPDDSTGEDILDETLVTDVSYDLLTGSSGADWFIINQGDKVTDFKVNNLQGDVVTVL